MSLIKIHFCVITVLQLSLLLLKATVVMYCDYNDRPCLSMFSIKCFKTNKIQPFFDFLLGLHRWPGQQFAIPETFNFSNKSAHTVQQA